MCAEGSRPALAGPPGLRDLKVIKVKRRGLAQAQEPVAGAEGPRGSWPVRQAERPSPGGRKLIFVSFSPRRAAGPHSLAQGFHARFGRGAGHHEA